MKTKWAFEPEIDELHIFHKKLCTVEFPHGQFVATGLGPNHEFFYWGSQHVGPVPKRIGKLIRPRWRQYRLSWQRTHHVSLDRPEGVSDGE